MDYFDGAIDDVRFYDYALSPTEVASLARTPQPVPAIGAPGLALLAGALVGAAVVVTRAGVRSRAPRRV